MLIMDPMQVLKSLPKLRILELIYCYNGKQLDCYGGDSFPQPEELHITALHNLEEIICGEERVMHKLIKVAIVDSNNLQQMRERFQQLCNRKQAASFTRLVFSYFFYCSILCCLFFSFLFIVIYSCLR